ncbi:MAG: TfoX/Sxy family protein [Pirellulales bacterium]|nr:TfoX/Sxy family protein [Pirellulales bacterium]
MGYRRKHTATGRAVDRVPIAKLQNLGVASSRWLAEVGIRTRGDLARVGPVLAYKLVREREPKANRTLLWCLFAALQDRCCLDVTAAEKRHLLTELERLQ